MKDTNKTIAPPEVGCGDCLWRKDVCKWRSVEAGVRERRDLHFARASHHEEEEEEGWMGGWMNEYMGGGKDGWTCISRDGWAPLPCGVRRGSYYAISWPTCASISKHSSIHGLLHDFFTKTSNLVWPVYWSDLYDLSCSHRDSYDIFFNCHAVIANNNVGQWWIVQNVYVIMDICLMFRILAPSFF